MFSKYQKLVPNSEPLLPLVRVLTVYKLDPSTTPPARTHTHIHTHTQTHTHTHTHTCDIFRAHIPTPPTLVRTQVLYFPPNQ